MSLSIFLIVLLKIMYEIQVVIIKVYHLSKIIIVEFHWLVMKFLNLMSNKSEVMQIMTSQVMK